MKSSDLAASLSLENAISELSLAEVDLDIFQETDFSFATVDILTNPENK